MEQSVKVGKRLGARIKNARKAKGLTQDQLAAQLQVEGCDLARYTLTRIETGKRHIKVEELEAIGRVLDMRYEDFFAQE
ncbi:MAG: helix-turn-helix domain-containing protein [Oscillospiraceae bacterium]|nr:helix-turn-helix domain-containing protein [Oscillospiraceae bacterium]